MNVVKQRGHFHWKVETDHDLQMRQHARRQDRDLDRRHARPVNMATLERLAVQAQLNAAWFEKQLLLRCEEGDILAVYETVRKLHHGGVGGKWYPLLCVLKSITERK